jgi:hypothetical protein
MLLGESGKLFLPLNLEKRHCINFLVISNISLYQFSSLPMKSTISLEIVFDHYFFLVHWNLMPNSIAHRGRVRD